MSESESFNARAQKAQEQYLEIFAARRAGTMTAKEARHAQKIPDLAMKELRQELKRLKRGEPAAEPRRSANRK